MARSRKGKLFNLFKDKFKITFFYKPTMIDDDIFYYIILDDLIKLKIKIIHGTLVIDDIIPVSTTYMAKVYNSLIEILTQQTDFTVLVSLTGNTSAFSSACIKCGAPIIDDDRFLSIPKNLYLKLKEYYNGDESKYGFYLLAVKDIDDEFIDENTIEAGKIPLVDKIVSKFEEKYGRSFCIKSDYGDWAKGKIIEIKGIRLKLTFDQSTNCVGLHNIDTRDMSSYFDLVGLCDILEMYCRKGDIIIYDIESPQLNDICKARGYRHINESKQKMLSFNQRYTQVTFGDYKIEKI